MQKIAPCLRSAEHRHGVSFYMSTIIKCKLFNMELLHAFENSELDTVHK